MTATSGTPVQAAPTTGNPQVDHHNDVLQRAEIRALELERQLVKILQPILAQAGDDAAAAFLVKATNHLTAAALWSNDVQQLAAMPAHTRRPTIASLALTAAAPAATSVMVCLKPRPDEAAAIATGDGEKPEHIHVTLATLGNIPADVDLGFIVDALARIAKTHPPLEGDVTGVGVFGDNGRGNPEILLPSVPGLIELRVEVANALQGADIEYGRKHGYLPHLTVDYDETGDRFPDRAVIGAPLHFDAIVIVRGDIEQIMLPLEGPVLAPVTAAGFGPPPWTPPAPNEIIDVQKLVKTLRGKTDPVRQAVIKTTMETTLSDAGIAWDATNPLTAKVLAQSGSQIQNIADTTQLNVMRTIDASYNEGLSIPDTAKAIQAGMQEASTVRATMIARCLPGETLVDGAVVRAVTRRWYQGDMVVLVTEAGREFTATPNHPMLTSRGWRKAGEVGEGDDLVCHLGHEHAGAPGDEDVADPPATIAEIFEAAAAVGVVERRRGGQPDFHGDGLDGEVDVARPGRTLTVGLLAALYQEIEQDVFAPADMVDGPSFCPSCGHLLAVDKSRCLCGAPCSDSGLGENAPDELPGDAQLGRDLLHGYTGTEAFDDRGRADVVAAGRGSAAVLKVDLPRLGERAALHTGRVKPRENGALCYADPVGGERRAQAADIELDRVVACRLVVFEGYVFNLVTPHGYFTVNGGYTGNTELAGAVNGGSLAATQIASEATGLHLAKVWMTAEGAKYPRHEDYDGLDNQTVALDEAFQVGEDQLQFPGDPSGSPGEVINCRCTMSYVEHEGGAEGLAALGKGPGADLTQAALPYVPLPTAGPFKATGLNKDGWQVQADGISVPGFVPIDQTTYDTIVDHNLTKFPPDPGPAAQRLFGAKETTEFLYSDGHGNWTPERKALHERIIRDIFRGRVKVGLGPDGEPVAVFTSGGGASGKGGSFFTVDGKEISVDQITGDAAKGIPPDLRFVHIDPDAIKAMIPEYQQMLADGDIYAASGVHEESSYLAKEITRLALDRGYNVLLDTTGSGDGLADDKFLKKIKDFKNAGYDVQVTMSSVDTNVAMERMVTRGNRTGRFVAIRPLKEAHAMSAQSHLAWRDQTWIRQWRLYDNTGAKTLVAEAHDGVITVHDQALYDKILAKRGELNPGAVEKVIATDTAETVPAAINAAAETEVLTTAKDAAAAAVDGMKLFLAAKGEVATAEDVAKAEKNFGKLFKGRVIDDPAEVAKLAEAAAYNDTSPVFQAQTALHGADRVVALKDVETKTLLDGSPGEAASRMATNHITIVREKTMETTPSGAAPGPIRPGMPTTSSLNEGGGGLPATLRHEYGHQIEETLTPDQKREFRADLPDAETVKKELSIYGSYGLDVGNAQEAFSELFSIVSDPAYDPGAWQPWVRDLGHKWFDGPLVADVAAPAELTFDTSAVPKAADLVNEAQAAISKVLDVPADVKFVELPADDAATARSLADGTIGIHTDTVPNPEMAVSAYTHEFGHWLDRFSLGDGTEFATQTTDPAMQHLYTLLKESPTMQAVRNDEIKILEGDTQTRNYMLQGREMFARAFDQYIAETSGDPALVANVDKTLGNPHLAFQYWPHDEFAPIRAALDDLFREKGLLRQEIQTVPDVAAPATAATVEDFTSIPATLPAANGVTPEVLAEQLAAQAALMEPGITAGLEQVVGALGGHMEGLDFKLKKQARLAEKIADDAKVKNVDPEEAADKIFDALRYTGIFDPADYANGVARSLDALRQAGLDVSRVKNFWRDGDGTYVGVNAIIRAPNGFEFELQFHTADSFYVKETLNHGFYEEQRTLQAAINERGKGALPTAAEQKRLDELADKMRANAATVAHPPQVDAIETFPKKAPVPLKAVQAPGPAEMLRQRTEAEGGFSREYAEQERQLVNFLTDGLPVPEVGGPMYGESRDADVIARNKVETMKALGARLADNPVWQEALPVYTTFDQVPDGELFYARKMKSWPPNSYEDELYRREGDQVRAWQEDGTFGPPAPPTDLTKFQVADQAVRMHDLKEGDLFRNQGDNTLHRYEGVNKQGYGTYTDVKVADETVEPLVFGKGTSALKPEKVKREHYFMKNPYVERVPAHDKWRMPTSSLGGLSATDSEHTVAALVQNWAGSAADHDPWAIALQKAIVDEFSLDAKTLDVFASRGETTIKSADEIYQEKGAQLRTFVRAMYDETQARLKAAGISDLTIYRGMDQLDLAQAKEVVADQIVHMQPASSFAAQYTTAAKFSGDNGAILAAKVPAERVLSFPGTGFGCLNETEFVTLAPSVGASADRVAIVVAKNAEDLPTAPGEFWRQVEARDRPVELKTGPAKIGSARTADKLAPGQFGTLDHPGTPGAYVFKTVGVDDLGNVTVQVMHQLDPADTSVLHQPGAIVKLSPADPYFPLVSQASGDFADIPAQIPELRGSDPAKLAVTMIDQAATMEPIVTAGLKKLADSLGGEMKGLDFRLKGHGSLVRKIADDARVKAIEPLKAADGVHDVLRYTAVFDREHYVDGVNRMLDQLRDQGLDVTRLKNFWEHGDGTYVGINTLIRTPNGFEFELQFHTQRGLLVKEKYLHPLYEKQRVSTDAAEEEKIAAEMKAHTATVPYPDGVRSIEQIPPPKPTQLPPTVAPKADDMLNTHIAPEESAQAKKTMDALLGPDRVVPSPREMPVYQAEEDRLGEFLTSPVNGGTLQSQNGAEKLKRVVMQDVAESVKDDPAWRAAQGPQPIPIDEAAPGTVYIQGDTSQGMKMMRYEGEVNGRKMVSSWDLVDGWSTPVPVPTAKEAGLPEGLIHNITPIEPVQIEDLRIGDQFRLIANGTHNEGARVFQFEGLDEHDTPLFSEPAAKSSDGNPYRFQLSTVSGDMVERVAPGDTWRLPRTDHGDTVDENITSALIQNWATSSADHNAWSIALQKAVQEEFGLDPQTLGVFQDRTAYALAGSDAIMAEKGDVLRLFVRKMYEQTQARFKAAGIDQITVYRGVKDLGNTARVVDANAPMTLQPASSFSSIYTVAENFANSAGGVYAVTVPVERVLGSAATGWGCLSEGEFVLLGPTEGAALTDTAAAFLPGETMSGYLPGSADAFWTRVARESKTVAVEDVNSGPAVLKSAGQADFKEMKVGDVGTFHKVGKGVKNDVVFKMVGVSDSGDHVLEVVGPVSLTDAGTIPEPGTVLTVGPNDVYYKLEDAPLPTVPETVAAAPAPLQPPQAAEMTAIAHDDVPAYQAEQTKLETFLARGEPTYADESPQAIKEAQKQKEAAMQVLSRRLDDDPVWQAAAPTQQVMEIEKMPIGTTFVDPESRTQLYRYEGPGQVSVKGKMRDAPHTFREARASGWGEARPLEKGAPRGSNVFGIGRKGSVGEVTPIVSVTDLKVGDRFRPPGTDGVMLLIKRFDENGDPVVQNLAFPERGERAYTWDKLVEPMGPDDQIWRMPESEYVDKAKATQSEARAAGVVDGWAATSADHSAWAVATQKAVVEEFGLAPATLDLYADRAGVVAEADSVMADKALALRAVVRAMYDETQRQLAAEGIDELTLYRGVKGVVASGGKEIDPNVVVHLQPMSAFSGTYKTARLFAGDDGLVMAVRVPRERILSMSGTGFGCLHENEFVVLGRGEGHALDHAAAIAARSYADIPATAGDFWAQVAARDEPVTHEDRLGTVGPKQALSASETGDLVMLDRPGAEGAMFQVLGRDSNGQVVVVALRRGDGADHALYKPGEIVKVHPDDSYYPLVKPAVPEPVTPQVETEIPLKAVDRAAPLPPAPGAVLKHVYLPPPEAELTSTTKLNLDHLARITPNVADALDSAGVEFFVGNGTVPTLDDLGALTGVTPRGWAPGSSWDTVPGCYSPKGNLVAVGNGAHGGVSLALHETGHAIEQNGLLGPDARDLVDQHEKLYDGLSPYFRQGGPRGVAGVQELFAESYAAYSLGGTDGVVTFLTKGLGDPLLTRMRGPIDEYAQWFDGVIKRITRIG